MVEEQLNIVVIKTLFQSEMLQIYTHKLPKLCEQAQIHDAQILMPC